MLKTAILIDGSDSPVALRLEEGERKPYIAQGRPSDTPRNFKFVRMDGDVAIYRLDGDLKDELSDALFERSAAAEADKFLNPKKYESAGKVGPLSNREREELESLRAQVAAKAT